VLIEGLAGVGKTALVEQFIDACGPGVVVRRARADEIDQTRPFSLLQQLLQGAGQTAPVRPRRGRQRLDPEPDPLAAGAELLELLGALQGSARLAVIVLDDIHFADGPSSAALVIAFRRLLADRVLVMVTARSGHMDSAWGRLVYGTGGTQILLSGLGLDDLRALTASSGEKLSEAELARLQEVTDGHPLYASAVLLSGNRGDALRGEALPPPPPPLADLVVAQLRSCGPGTQALVAAAGVLGRDCALVAAAQLAQVENVPDAIDEAIKAGIFADPGQPALHLRFTHALVHAACYQSLGRATLAELHSRAARMTSGARRLHHRLVAANGPDGALGADLEEYAESERKAGALIAAGEHFRQAAGVTPAGAAADRRLLAGTEAWLIAGEATRALALEAQVRSAAEGPYRDYVLGYLALVSGRIPEAEVAFRRAWAATWATEDRGAPADLGGRVAVCMSILVVLTLSTNEMLAWAERARAMVEPNEEPEPFAWFCSALALGTLGRPAEALKVLGADGVPVTADVLTAKGLMEMWCDDVVPARQHLAMAFVRSRGGETIRVTQGIGFLAECEYRLGLLGESSVHAELAVEAATQAGRLWDLPLLHSLAAYPAATSGNDGLAEAHVNEAANWAAKLPIPAFRAYAGAAAAVLALARDDDVALLEAARAIDEVYGLADMGTASFGPVLAEALLRHDRLEEAEEALAAFESRAAASGRRSALLGASRVRGQLAFARRDPIGATKAFMVGAYLVRRLDLPLEVGRWAEAYGRFLIAVGRRDEGRDRLHAAVSTFERIAAVPYARRARAALEDAEVSSGRRPELSQVALRLSATETMVVHLVAAGRSNKQIAAELVVSVKTVEYHISNIYRRLGVTSRVKLAQMVQLPP
jgi:DNA-binding CsgD family transcriptional regulator